METFGDRLPQEGSVCCQLVSALQSVPCPAFQRLKLEVHLTWCCIKAFRFYSSVSLSSHDTRVVVWRFPQVIISVSTMSWKQEECRRSLSSLWRLSDQLLLEHNRSVLHMFCRICSVSTGQVSQGSGRSTTDLGCRLEGIEKRFVFLYAAWRPLVKKVHEGRVVEIVDSLCQKLLTGKEQQRDIASIALKTVVAEISSGNVAQCVVVSLTPKLIKGITTPVGHDFLTCFISHSFL